MKYDKKVLRKKFLTIRSALDKDFRKEASKKIFESIESLDVFKNAKRVFVYISFGDEVATKDFIEKHLKTKEIYVPKIVDKDMKLVRITSLDNLKTSSFGILEPRADDYYTGFIDVVITPGISFTKKGVRLGYGGGYYDKFFAKNSYKKSIGVCFFKLISDSLPKEEYDKCVDMVVSEKGIYKCYDSNDKCERR